MQEEEAAAETAAANTLKKIWAERWKKKETIHLVDYGRLQSYNNNSFYCLLLFDGLFLFVLCLLFFPLLLAVVIVDLSKVILVLARYINRSQDEVEEEEEGKIAEPFTIWAVCTNAFIEISSQNLKTHTHTLTIFFNYILRLISNPIHIIYFNCDIKVNILREVCSAITNKYEHRHRGDKAKFFRRFFLSVSLSLCIVAIELLVFPVITNCTLLQAQYHIKNAEML